MELCFLLFLLRGCAALSGSRYCAQRHSGELLWWEMGGKHGGPSEHQRHVPKPGGEQNKITPTWWENQSFFMNQQKCFRVFLTYCKKKALTHSSPGVVSIQCKDIKDVSVAINAKSFFLIDWFGSALVYGKCFTKDIQATCTPCTVIKEQNTCSNVVKTQYIFRFFGPCGIVWNVLTNM